MTKRQAIDDCNSWFSIEAATKFTEATQWDGRNHISVPTGSQWEHECLYLTKSGKWVLNSYSNFEGRSESWTLADEDEAALWLMQNGHTHPSVEAAIAAMEV